MRGGKPSPASGYLTLQIIWFSMVVSVAIYILVAHLVTRDVSFGKQGPVAPIAFALGVFGAVLFAAQLYFRSLLSDGKLFPRIHAELASDLSGPAEVVPLLLKNHATFNIVLWTLGEFPAIFGLMLTLLSGDMRYVAGFSFYSFANLFLFRPRQSAFEEQSIRFRRYLGARPSEKGNTPPIHPPEAGEEKAR